MTPIQSDRTDPLSLTWYFQAKGQSIGPLSFNELKTLVQSGKVNRNTLIGQSANGPWNVAANVGMLFAVPPRPAPQGKREISQGVNSSGTSQPMPPHPVSPVQRVEEPKKAIRASHPMANISSSNTVHPLTWVAVGGGVATAIVTVLVLILIWANRSPSGNTSQITTRTSAPLDRTIPVSGGSKPPAPSDATPPQIMDSSAEPKGLISSATEEHSLKHALARVQLIDKLMFNNGSVIESPIGHGTAFCVTPSGYFLTNRHVIESYQPKEREDKLTAGARKIPIIVQSSILLFIEQLRFEAQLIHTSSRYDLAILKIERARTSPYFPLSSTGAPPLLSDVYALGFPGVASQATESEQAGIKAGFVSEVGKAMNSKRLISAESQLPKSAFGYSAVPGAITKVSSNEIGAFVFHSASIHGGNSGGPLISKAGTVIAINTAILRDLDIRKNGSSDVIVLNDGNLSMSYLTNQFRAELEEFIPDKLVWK